MKIKELKNKKILVLGVRQEGEATLRFLRHFLPEVEVLTADQKDGKDYLKRQDEADVVIKTPGIHKKMVTKPYTTAANLFFGNVRGKTIGITGTKGKSTTAALLYAILKEAGYRVRLIGNIGNPMLDALITSNDPNEWYVVELSSFQLDDIEYSPHISVILNLFPEHMDYHGSVEDYWAAKLRIAAHAGEEDFYVYNPQYEKLRDLAVRTKAQAVPIETSLPMSDADIPLLGEHNRDNIRAAATVAHILKISDEATEHAIKNFKPLPHRLELVGTFKGITFYDDAISTTPESTIQAIRAIPNIGTIFLGGLDRGYDFSELARAIAEKRTPNIVFFPDSGKRIQEAFALLRYTPAHILETKSMEEAVKFAYAHTPAGSVCLLSCASPSFSIWKNFEEKGDEFRKFVVAYRNVYANR